MSSSASSFSNRLLYQEMSIEKGSMCSYTPGIYAEGYIAFVCSFVRLYVHLFLLSVSLVEFTSKFLVKISLGGYISQTTHQKAFIFGPWVP